MRVVDVGGVPGGPGAVAIDSGLGRVYVAIDDTNHVAVLDARTGTLLHSVDPNPLSGTISTALPVADEGRDRVYALLSSPYGRDNALDGPGSIAVLDAPTGAVHGVAPLSDTIGGGPNFGLAIDARLHHLIVLTDNHVTILDATRL